MVGTFTNELANQLISDSRYSEFLGIMLTGSCADGSFNSRSDIDIVALAKHTPRLRIETLVYNDVKIQLIIFPFYKFSSTIFSDLANSHDILVSMVKKGIILKDTEDELFRKMQTFLACKKKNIFSEKEKLHLKAKITGALDDLSTSNSLAEKVFSAAEVLKNLAALISNTKSEGKHLGRELVKHHKLYKSLIDCYTTATYTENYDSYIQKTEEILSCYGGRIDCWSTSYLLHSIRNKGYIAVQLPSHNIYNEVVFKTVENITQGFPANCSQTFYIGPNQTLERGIYIILHAEPEYLQNLITSLTRYFKANIDQLIRQNIRVSYPYQYTVETELLLGGTSYYNGLVPLFCEYSNLIWGKLKKIKNEKKNWVNTQAISLALFLGKEVFSSKKRFIDFANYFLSRYEAEIIDINGIYSSYQIPIVKSAILNYHKELFDGQKTSLQNLHNLTFQSDYISSKDDMLLFYLKLSSYLRRFPINIDDFNELYTDLEREDIFTYHVFIHLFSILHIEPYEVYSIFYNVYGLIISDNVV